VLWLSYLVDARIGGTQSAVFHATNLLLHLAACSLAYVLLRRFGSGWRTALLLALVLCVHPALVSVVGWIPCRNDTLLAIFAMAAVLAVPFLERPRLASAAAVLASTALALFAKESGLALLPVLAALALCERGLARMRSRPLWGLGVASAPWRRVDAAAAPRARRLPGRGRPPAQTRRSSSRGSWSTSARPCCPCSSR
jgi:hypothetical protein